MSLRRRWVERWGRVGSDGAPGVMAEFGDPEALVAAVRRLREEGWERLDAYTPYEVEGLAEALGMGRSIVPWLAGIAGFAAAAAAYLLMWWINVVDYPLDVGGRPLHSAPAFVPITFETGILFAGTTAFLAFLFAGGMPRLWHPAFEAEGFESATVDGYWLAVDRESEGFDPDALGALLREAGAVRVLEEER